MTSNKWMSLYVASSVAVMGILYAMVHDVKAEQAVMEYQLSKIHETLSLHTEKLEILVGSQYEMHSQLDKLIKE